MTEEWVCIGCGSKIQSDDKLAAGFLPLSALTKKLEETPDAEIICQRCFRLRHYNEIAPSSLTDADFLRLLNSLADKNALIVNVIDIFDFNGSLIPRLARFVGGNDVLLVANKRDVLPHSLKVHKLTAWIAEEAKKEGLLPLDVRVISAKNQDDVRDLMLEIEAYRAGRDVYVVGVTNVGKSTLINAIIREAAGNENVITTSRFPGTTLDKIEIPLGDGTAIIDTPGIIHRGQMAHYLKPDDLKYSSPRKEIKPKTYQLNPEQTLFLGGLARFDYLAGARAGITAFVDNELVIHRTKQDGATEFFAKHVGELLKPSVSETLVRKEFKISETSDIVFSGLGWIRVPQGSKVAAWVPDGVEVIVRRALIG
ncbi:MAG: ribosome biogenesis GTPase YqeH [Streptococcaceae bacterium]|jgi:ribosome biogenesis GTPase YqeH|nr:ribosome biogenesis GTPase YqeH [Streptococcaceae bacterium]